ncbi:hypothetical protein PG996_006264 [Apiospora saccharicola]|uniref:Methyltransferase domain-containing protein n=1 Tax=Apiospora saccharicola TaxID=335842 RepID=A0ABR1VNT9_9PEZI
MASPAASLLPTMKLEDVAHEDSVLVQGQLTESVASPSSAFVSQVRTAAAALFLTMGDGKDTAESSIAPGSPSTIGDEDEFEPSDFDEESLDDTTSVGSSVYGHSYRNGRRYHKAQQNREDMLHAMMMEVTNGRLFYAPIDQHPQKIVDLGTGTGIWAIEVVESRLTSGARSNLKPGGWVELQDVDGAVHCDDGSLPSDWPLVRFCDLMIEAFAKLGGRSHAAMFGGNYLHEAGFVNIQHRTAKLPYGTWPKDKTMRLVGLYYRTAAEEFFPAMGAIQMPLLGWSKEEMEVFFAQCRSCMRDESVHAYGFMHFWSGQKPESS